MKVARLMAGDARDEVPSFSCILSREDLDFMVDALEDETARCRDSHEIARGELLVRLLRRASQHI